MSSLDSKNVLIGSLAFTSVASIAYLVFKAYAEKTKPPSNVCYKCRNYVIQENEVDTTIEPEHLKTDKVQSNLVARKDDLEGRLLKE